MKFEFDCVYLCFENQEYDIAGWFFIPKDDEALVLSSLETFDKTPLNSIEQIEEYFNQDDKFCIRFR